MQGTYRTMFRLLRSHCLDLRIAKLQMDFEVAAHNAAKEVFPEAEVRGCRFHPAQAWFRKLGRLGLHSVYNHKTSKTAIWLKSIFGLPGLEPEEVEQFFNQELKSQAPERPAVAAFILYLSQTYITDGAKFPPTMWAGIMDGGKHTTNMYISLFLFQLFVSFVYNLSPIAFSQNFTQTL